jgi:hypothetical protein
MRPDEPVQDFPALGKGIKGSDLIGSHEAAIALNVGRKDSSNGASLQSALPRVAPVPAVSLGGSLIRPSWRGQSRFGEVALSVDRIGAFLVFASQLR